LKKHALSEDEGTPAMFPAFAETASCRQVGPWSTFGTHKLGALRTDRAPYSYGQKLHPALGYLKNSSVSIRMNV